MACILFFTFGILSIIESFKKENKIKDLIEETKKELNTQEDSDDYLEVATTRPETMFGDTAVAVNPKDKRYNKLETIQKIETNIDGIINLIHKAEKSINPIRLNTEELIP